MDFKTLQGDSCRVSLLYEGFSGAITTLYGGTRPFVLKEFNTDEDLFKPIRPQLAEIEILGGYTNLSINDFLANTDTDIEVRFYFIDLQNPYWIGYMLQDDFQEVWINTSNIITLRATEAIGLLKGREIRETNGNELNGKYTFLNMIQIAMNNTSQNFTKYYAFSNLFHTSMTDTSTNTGLDQCYFNSKTFMQNSSEYDDCYTVLEKINKSWNQTIFMYNGYWYIFRQEELNADPSQNMRGFVSNSSVRTLINRRYDVEVGVNEEVKPISPDMLRFIKRKTKKDTIQFEYNQYDEIVCNGAFNRGSLISSTSTKKIYNLDSWDWYQGALNSTTVPTTGSRGRAEEFDSFTFRLTDQYAYLTQDSATSRNLKSCDIEMLKGEKISFSIDTKFAQNFTGVSTQDTVIMMLYGTTTNYTLDDDGKWYASNSTFSTNLRTLKIYYNGTPAITPNQWNTLQIESEPLPEDGNLKIVLWCSNSPFISNQERRFKSLNLEIYTSVSGNNLNNINGVQSIFTKTDQLNNFFQDDIFFDDGLSKVYDGSIFQSNQTTLTDQNWYRYKYNLERFGFRKQNAIAKWTNNRFNRNKIDANFYGLKYNSEPIGLINTIKFVDDDPNKIYAILNLKEIDFAASVWSATLLEVYNSETDQTSANISKTFTGSVTLGIYNNPTLLPITATQLANFSIQGGNFIRNDGLQTIDTTLNFNLDFNVITTDTTPGDFYIRYYVAGSVIRSQLISVTINPEFFTITTADTISVPVGQTIYFQIEPVTCNVTSIEYLGGSITMNYTYQNNIVYDSYEDKYLYK